MPGYVITNFNDDISIARANRLKKSAESIKLEIRNFPVQPKADRTHIKIWEKCIEHNTILFVFEENAIITGDLPKILTFNRVVNFCDPLTGDTPPILGLQALASGDHFLTTAGYMIDPAGAKELLNKEIAEGQSVGQYMNNFNFPFLQEYYPYIVTQKD